MSVMADEICCVSCELVCSKSSENELSLVVSVSLRLKNETGSMGRTWKYVIVIRSIQLL